MSAAFLVSVARHANILTRLEYGIVRHVEIAVMVYMSEKSDKQGSHLPLVRDALTGIVYVFGSMSSPQIESLISFCPQHTIVCALSGQQAGNQDHTLDARVPVLGWPIGVGVTV